MSSSETYTTNSDATSLHFSNYTSIYFVGIGGIGMSALAQYFKALGCSVYGYDKTETPLTISLQNLGIIVYYKDDISLVNTSAFNTKTTLVVYTPAIQQSHQHLKFFNTQGFKVLKRSEILGEITRATTCLAVAGTHGKTTTTSILGHILASSNAPLTAFLGGISENYNSNLILKGTEVSVVEADEFDRSFLTLSPNIACITSMDADHLDIYGSKDALEVAFNSFAKKLKPKGTLFVKKGLPIKGITYGVNEGADFEAINIEIQNNLYRFSLKTPQDILPGFEFVLPGRHNLSNAVVAIAMALTYGCNTADVIAALKTYSGVKRRFSYKILTKNFVFIDDYAHHPTEIDAVYQAVTELYPNTKTMVIFQPHLYSRTSDFLEQFANSLSQFNCVRLLPIYPARELPIEGVNSQVLLNKMTISNKKYIQKPDIFSEIVSEQPQLLITLGAGDIGIEVEYIKQKLLNEN